MDIPPPVKPKPKPKKTCKISLPTFTSKAKPLKVLVHKSEVDVGLKVFSTGSFGWYHHGRVEVVIDGISIPVQVGITLTIVGSKDAPRV